MQKLSLYFFASLLAGCLAFSTFSMKKSSHRNAREPGNALCMLARDEVRVTAAQRESDACNRRTFLGVASVVASFFLANPASARDELYRSNMLTNPVLEQIRILNQAEADDLKYGGELAPGNAGNKGKVDAYPKLLAPILKMDEEMAEVKRLVRDENGRPESWKKALDILKNEKYDKIAFKKTFNAYGDNIYYNDPDRANLYLGGGATPKTEQSLAYLLRNDLLTNIENLRAELEYLLKTPEEEVDDLYSYADIVAGAMKKYLALAPPSEIEAAQKIINSN